MQETCSACGLQPVTIYPRFFPNGKKRMTDADPKYLFHVRADCNNCGSFVKFLPQTADVMSELNKRVYEADDSGEDND